MGVQGRAEEEMGQDARDGVKLKGGDKRNRLEKGLQASTIGWGKKHDAEVERKRVPNDVEKQSKRRRTTIRD
jgi:hypothetical protein